MTPTSVLPPSTFAFDQGWAWSPHMSNGLAGIGRVGPLSTLKWHGMSWTSWPCQHSNGLA
eukprot:3493565-Heterocapsa_arctica.AAC.1